MRSEAERGVGPSGVPPPLPVSLRSTTLSLEGETV